MRTRILFSIFGALLMAGVPFHGAHADGTQQAEVATPDPMIIQVAQHLLVKEMNMSRDTLFSPVTIHPQPQGRYWAVVGRLSFKNEFLKRFEEKVYVAAVRQTCDDYQNVQDCWQLQKLAMDNEIVIDKGDPEPLPEKL